MYQDTTIPYQKTTPAANFLCSTPLMGVSVYVYEFVHREDGLAEIG